MPIESPTSELELQRRYWRLAAILFIGGGLGAIPADALHRPAHDPTIYLLPLLALASGALAWFCADRVSRRWLPLMAAVATFEIALTVYFAGDVFASYYILVAFYAAYVFSDRRVIAAEFALASLLALAPIVYDPDTARDTVIQGLVLIPTLLLTAGAITYLRERLEASEDRFRRLAERDPLTGVGNYRMLSEKAPSELERHGRYGHELALILIDLNDFKRVNDLHGHLRGDRVLQEVAGSLMGNVRGSDMLIRHGGDEFCVLAPETDRESACELAGRIRDGIAELVVGDQAMGACTGVAVYPVDAQNLNGLMAHADGELATSKDSTPRIGRSPN
jgi:diguanylate cyclase (GGDEF)-like protein